MEAVLLRMNVAIAREIEALKLSTDEARRRTIGPWSSYAPQPTAS